MAIVNTKSTEVQNLDARPAVLLDRRTSHGRVRKKVATVEVAAADDDGSVYRLARLHSSWNVHAIWIHNDAITGGTGYDVGLYEPGDGAAVDDDVYAATLGMATARTTAPVNAAFGARDIAKAGDALWQDLGLAEDPDRVYDLALTADTVGSAAGTITAIVEYTGD